MQHIRDHEAFSFTQWSTTTNSYCISDVALICFIVCLHYVKRLIP